MSITDPNILLRLNAARTPRADKPPARLKNRSKSLKDKFKGYKKQVKIFLSKPENLLCKIRMEGCKNLADCVHHVSGRIGDKLTDETDWMPACASCNLWVEENDAEARKKGFKKSRLGKEVQS